MPLKVVTGRANAGKTGWILRWAIEALDAGVAPTLMVPSLADVRRMQMELSDKAPLGIRVSTAASFAEELWQLNGDGRRLIGDATRAAVLRNILSGSIQDDLVASARAPGFERLMIRAAEQCSLGGGVDRPVANEASALVVELLAKYREELKELGLIEPEWIGSILADAVPQFGFLGTLRFTTYSDSEVDLLCSLSERNAVCVALTWEDGFAPTAANDGAAAALLGRAAESRVAHETAGSSELELLAERLYGDDRPIVPAGQVRIGEAKGREAEACLAIGLAAAAIREGVAPERIAVVFPQLAPRLNLLRNAVAAEGLEADFDCPLMVGATPFGRALAALLSLALGRGARAQALEFAQGPYSDADPVAVRLADQGWRQNRQTEDAPRVLVSVIALRGATGQAAELCRDIVRVPVNDVSARKWQELADTLISTAARLDTRGVQSDDASAHRSVTRAISQMASVAGHPFGAVDLLDALPLLPCALSAEESVGRIQVVQASRIGSRRFDEVIVGGLTKSESPGVSRETFASEVDSLVSSRARSAEEPRARLEFYSLVTRARKRVSFVRQTVGSGGEVHVASPLLDDVLDVYRNGSVDSEPAGVWHHPLETMRCEDPRAFAPVFTRGRREQRLLSEDLMPASRVVSRGAVDCELAERAVGGRVFSATEIEAYLDCPYRWFYSRILRPSEIDTELDAAALGSRAHRLISDFYDAWKGEGQDRVTEGNVAAALQLFESSAERSENRMAPAMSMGEEIDVGRARLWARHVIEDDAHLLTGYAPFGHEVGFGSEPVFEFAGVPLAGRIDRIDASPVGVVVSDYKSTRDVGKLARLGPSLGIQHILYAAAAEQLLGRPVLGSVYRSLRTRQLRGFWRRELLESVPADACENDVIDEPGFSALIALAEERVAGAVDGIRAGRIARSPRAATSCRYCPLHAFCEGARP